MPTPKRWSEFPTVATLEPTDRLMVLDATGPSNKAITTDALFDMISAAIVAEAGVSGAPGNPVNDGGADVTGVADATPLIQAQLNLGKKVRLNPDGIYRIATSIDLSAGGTLHGNGAKLVQSANVPVIIGTGVWGTPINVTTLVQGTYQFPTANSVTSSVTATVASHTIAVGDRVRVVSSDLAAGGDPVGTSGGANKQRTAQFFNVGAVTATEIIMPGLIRDPMTTNIRIVKVPEIPVTLTGINITSSDPIINLADGINLNGVRPKVVGLSMDGLGGHGMRLRGCYDIYVDDVECRHGVNSDSDHISYGICAEACETGIIRGLRGNRYRHLFTTLGLNLGATTANVSAMGRTRDITVVDGTAWDCFSSGFDTHPYSENITFVGCSATQAHSGYGGSNSKGLQLRGRNERMIGCTSAGHQYGAEVWADIVGNGINCSFENCLITDCEWGLYVQDDTVGGQQLVVSVKGGRIEATSRAIFGVNHKRVTIDGGADLAVTGTGGIALYNATGMMVMRGGSIDVTETAGTGKMSSSAGVGVNVRVSDTALIGTFAQLHDSTRSGSLTPLRLDTTEATITSMGGVLTQPLDPTAATTELIRDTMNIAIVAGPGATVTANDPSDTITIGATVSTFNQEYPPPVPVTGTQWTVPSLGHTASWSGTAWVPITPATASVNICCILGGFTLLLDAEQWSGTGPWANLGTGGVTLNASVLGGATRALDVLGKAKIGFDGTAGYAEVPDNVSLNFTVAQSFTLLAVKRDAAFALGEYVLSKNSVTTNAAGYHLRQRNSTLASDSSVTHGDGTTSQTATTAGTTTALVDTTNMTYAERNGTANTAQTWLNGAGGTSVVTPLLTATLSNAFPLRIARNASGTANYGAFDGYTFGVLRRLLTANERIVLEDWRTARWS